MAFLKSCSYNHDSFSSVNEGGGVSANMQLSTDIFVSECARPNHIKGAK